MVRCVEAAVIAGCIVVSMSGGLLRLPSIIIEQWRLGRPKHYLAR